MKKLYDALLVKARKLEKHIDTDWAYKHESKYEAFENKIEDAYAKGKLTDAEFDALAAIAFFDYPDLKGDYDDETFVAAVMALDQPISKYHWGTCHAGMGPREED